MTNKRYQWSVLILWALTLFLCYWKEVKVNVPSADPLSPMKISQTTTHRFDTNVYTHFNVPLIERQLYVDTVKLTIDTAAFITDYLTRKVTDQQLIDTNIVIDIQDSLYKNSITGSVIKYRLLRPISTSTNITAISPYKAALFLGAEGYYMFNKPGFFVITAFQDKHRNIYSAAYAPLDKGYKFSICKPIWPRQ